MTDIANNPHQRASRRVALQVNGQEVTVDAEHPHLLAALRDELDITSPKDGCSPSG
jgi:aerobic-type carbon monoxide dehydrogenase small subunit (CoxS/CutS family)